MTTYAGEGYTINSVPKDHDGEPLTADQISGVVVDIYNPSRERVVADAAMTYNADDELWFYRWNTEGSAPGTYKIKVTVTGIDGVPNWEWIKFRLARDPVPVP